MRLFYTSIIFTCCLFLGSHSFAQTTLSGIINKYAKVTAIDAVLNTVTVSDVGGLTVCDTVLIIQMKGAAINRTNTSNYGTVTAYNGAGTYEKAVIYNIVGTTIFFRHKLLNTYNPAGFVQLVSIPQFSSVAITTSLTGKTWDGNTGGIIAFEASDVVKITGVIDAVGIGFRGGSVNTNGACATNSASDYAYLPAQNLGAFKGESFASLGDSIVGKGAPANGGGGGSCANGGGGGGSNAGIGGLGGKSPLSLGGLATVSGIGGRAFSYSPSTATNLFLGGGGGGGHQDDGLASGGGNGGGIIYIVGKQIVGGGTINASGQSPLRIAGTDGSGGGGSGGAILLQSVTNTLKVTLLAKGADGGNINATDAAGTAVTGCFAPGGGGGGGVIALRGTIDGATVSNEGGNAGKITSTISTCTATTYGASAGSTGVLLTSVPLMPMSSVSVVPSIAVSITTTPATCAEATQTLTATVLAGARYQWLRNGLAIAGQTSNVLTATSSGVYRVQVSIGCNTTASYEEVVTVGGKPIAMLINNASIALCPTPTANVNLVAIQGIGYVYQWRKDGALIAGATTAVFNATTPGVYSVDVSVCGTTTSSNEITVYYEQVATVSLQAESTVLCPAKTITLLAFPRGLSYQWYKDGIAISGAIGDTYEATQAGTYWFVSLSLCITRTSKEYIITESAVALQPTITGQPTICVGKSTVLKTAVGGKVLYTWLRNEQAIPNATQSSYTATQTGEYKVTVIDECKRTTTSAAFSVTTVEPPKDISIKGNTLLCGGEARLATTTPKNKFYTYQWTLDGQTLQGAIDTTVLAKKVGRYTIKVTDTCGAVYESPLFFINANPVTNLKIQTPNNRMLICPTETIVLSGVSNFATNDLQWQRNGLDIPLAIGSTYKATVAGNYTVRTRNICDNVVSPSFVLQTATPPPASISGKLVFCFGDKTTLTANEGQNLIYQWFKNGEVFPNATSQSIPVFLPATYTVAVTNEQGCTTLSDEVIVTTSRIDETKVKITDSKLICIGDKVQLSVTGGVSYEWSPRATINNPFSPNPVVSPTETTTYKVKISNAIGCFVERFVTIEVVPSFEVAFDVKISSECGQRSLVQIVNTSTGLNAFNDIVWDMGNGDVLKGLSPAAYIYPKGGTYTIKMTATNRTCTKTYLHLM